MTVRQTKPQGRGTQGPSIRLSVELGTDREPPREFRIFRKGLNRTEKGDFLFDEVAAEVVMANYAMHGKKLRFDFNHGTTFDAPTPEQAIAGGSFDPEVRPNGELWATNCTWTERAAEYLRKGEYTEFSPLFNQINGRIVWLRNVALTNLPAMDDTVPLVAATANGGSMDAEKCTACSAKDTEIAGLTSKLTALSSSFDDFKKKFGKDDDGEGKKLTALRSSLVAITGESSEDAIVGAVKALKKDAGEAVALRSRIESQEANKLTSDFDGLVAKAIEECKIDAAQKDAFRADFLVDGKVTQSGLTALSAFVKHTAPKRNTSDTTQKGTSGTVLVTEADRAAAKLLGNSVEEIAKYKEAQLKEQAGI